MTHNDEHRQPTIDDLSKALVDLAEIVRHVLVYDLENGWDSEERLARIARIYETLNVWMPDASAGKDWMEPLTYVPVNRESR